MLIRLVHSQRSWRSRSAEVSVWTKRARHLDLQPHLSGGEGQKSGILLTTRSTRSPRMVDDTPYGWGFVNIQPAPPYTTRQGSKKIAPLTKLENRAKLGWQLPDHTSLSNGPTSWPRPRCIPLFTARIPARM